MKKRNDRLIRNITFFVLFIYVLFANKKLRLIMFLILSALTLFLFSSLVINLSSG